MAEKIGRREFVKTSAKIGLSAALGNHILVKGSHALSHAFAEQVDMSVAIGSDYFQNTIKAVEILGGMEKFVPKGAKVAILPNVQRWHPGTFTKPEIVRAIVQMCKKAGAAEVNCLSWLDEKNWEATGLQQVLKEEGANLKLVAREEALYKTVKVAKPLALPEAMIMKEFYNNDVFIDIPITKDHAGNKFTGTMKNLMGLNFQKNNRANFHKENWTTDINAIRHLEQCIVDLNTVVKPTLCIVDATEFIITNGPMGPGEIIKPQKVIAGTDRVAVDAYCSTLWDLKPADIIQIKTAHERGLGTMDLNKVRIKEIKI